MSVNRGGKACRNGRWVIGWTLLTVCSRIVVAAPANDSFEAGPVYNMPLVEVTGSNVGATREAGEPVHGADLAGRTVWYSWTAPAAGQLVAAVRGHNFRPAITIYRGDFLDALEPLASTRYEGFTEPYAAVGILQVTAGETLRIVVDAYFPQPTAFAPEGTFDLLLDLSTLKLISPTPAQIVEASAPMLLQVNVPEPAVNGMLSSVGYMAATWEQPQTFLGHSTTPPFDLSVLPPTNGLVVLVAVGTNQNGRIMLSPGVHVEVRPANDLFQNAILLSGHAWSVEASASSATSEAAEPPHGGSPATNSVWYSWVAPASGPASLWLYSGPTAHLGMYTGETVATLVSVPTIPNAEDPFEHRFNAVRGQVYRIAVDKPFDVPGVEPRGFRVDLQLHSFLLNDPQPGAPHREGAPISLTVTTTELASDVLRVDYLARPVYGETRSLATVTSFPYGHEWPDATPEPGGYLVRALLTRTDGAVLTSAEWPLLVRPRNDDFAHRLRLSGTNLVSHQSAAAASWESGEPAINAGAGEGSIWFSWTAPANGHLILGEVHASWPHTYHVFTGPTLESVELYARNATHGTSKELVAPVSSGTEYHFAAFDSGPLELRFLAVPAHDHFANAAIAPSGAEVRLTGHTVGASDEPNEPATGEEAAGRTIWFSWTAPQNGLVVLTDVTTTSQGAPRISPLMAAAYQGTSLTTLSPVERQPYPGLTAFAAVEGETYLIQIDDQAAYGDVQFEVQLSLHGALPHDRFALRQGITGHSAVLEYTSVGPTREPNEPDHGDYSLWWEWTAPGNGESGISAPHPGVRVDVYEGDELAGLQRVATSDYRLTFGAESGTTYHLAISASHGVFIERTLNWFHASAPPNDDFADRTLLEGAPLSFLASNVGATKEPGESSLYQHSVWWEWTAPASGTFTIAWEGSPATVGEVFQGSAIDQLTGIGSRYGPGPLTVNAVSGASYVIRTTTDGAACEFRLLVSNQPAGRINGSQAGFLDPQTFQLRVHRSFGERIRLDFSDDLASWTPFYTNQFFGGDFVLGAPLPAGHQQRFYRALPWAPE